MDDGSGRKGSLSRAARLFGWAGTPLKWAAIGFLLLFFAGLGSEGLNGMMQPDVELLRGAFWKSLLVFSLGGGVTLGVLMLTWQLASGDAFARALTLGAFAALLFALFVWPTPYKYYRDEALAFVVRINRITGDVQYCERGTLACGRGPSPTTSLSTR